MATVLTIIVTASVGTYTGLCWDEAKGNATDCKTGSPVPIEFLSIVAAVVPFILPWPVYDPHPPVFFLFFSNSREHCGCAPSLPYTG